MALDTRIPGENIASPLTSTQYAEQDMQLRHLAGQVRMQPGQQKMQDLQVQQAQQDQRDQQTMRQAYMQSGGDMDKFRQIATSQGVSPKYIQQIDLHNLQQRELRAKVDNEGLKNSALRHDQLRGEIMAFEQQPDEVKAQKWQSEVSRLRSIGLLTPEEAQQVPASYPGSEAMQLMAAGATSGSQMDKKILDQRHAEAAETTAAAHTLTAKTNAKKVESDLFEKSVRDAAGVLANSTDQADYEARKAKLDPKVAEKLPRQFDAETVRRTGMTPEQQSVEAGRDEARHIREQYNNDQIQLRKQMADQANATRQDANDIRRESLSIRRDQASRDRAQTANSLATERHQNSIEFSKADQDERQLNNLSITLGNALKSGKLYVTKTGQTIPIKKATGDTQESESDLRQEMQDRLGQTREDLHKTIDIKYNVMEKMGATPTVSRQQVHDAIDGKKSAPAAQPQQQAAPQQQPAPAKSTAAPKAFPKSRVAEYAAKIGKTPQETEQYLKSQGYALQ